MSAVRRRLVLALVAVLLAPPMLQSATEAAPVDLAVPHYDRIILVVEANRSRDRVVGSANAPFATALARGYGEATRMTGEAHPSEPNYLAIVGGDTFGVTDDDAWFCTPGLANGFCPNSRRPGYPNHDLAGPSLPSRLIAHRIGWRSYFGALPSAGFTGPISPKDDQGAAGRYVSEHDPIVSFSELRKAPDFAARTAPLTAFVGDLNAGALPPFALVVPDLCDDMHGMPPGRGIPADCAIARPDALERRGDRVLGDLFRLVSASPYWNSPLNVAFVATWDEGDARDGVPTIVATNHGPRGVADPTPYDHYGLLRTIEDALGLPEHLRHAGDPNVAPMTPLFRIAAPPAIRR